MARRLIEAGTKFVQVNRASVANGDRRPPPGILTRQTSGPEELIVRSWIAACRRSLEDMDQRGLLKETLVVAVGEFGRSRGWGCRRRQPNAPDGRDHWPYCYSAVVAGAGIAVERSMVNRTRPRLHQGEAGSPGGSARNRVFRARHRPGHGDPQSINPANW
jgi:hypothetical protein